MFDSSTLSNPTAAQNAAALAASRAATNGAVSSDADGNHDGELSQQRAIIDQIDLSIEANQRIEQAMGSFQHPVLEFETDVLEIYKGLKPALDDAQTRLNREAFIVLAMMGIPPAKARAMANAMTGGDPGDLKLANTGGNGGADSVHDLALSMSHGKAKVNLGQVSVSSRQVEIDFSSIETRFAKTAGKIDISVSEFKAHIEMIRVEIAQAFQKDPLILDLDGNGIDITSLEDGAKFDIDGDGSLDQTAWVSGGDALLALDRNGDGEINDGTELFGDQNGAKDGFAELAKYDDNHDGVIDESDAVFSSLVLLRADGSQSSLASEGIKSISLTMITPLDERLIGGDLVAKSGFTRTDGSQGTVGEVLFDVQA
ncbi:hypothetical protein MACH10_33730 [Thalassospira tepidiphila]|uniref:hypothetical protein n=1 Tax=Thalassospira tepidiphila TaxID=393657 RepID=UPI0029268750|nr:hypothetical protein MACH10_33730 [Thalassospira tepidiphila]